MSATLAPSSAMPGPPPEVAARHLGGHDLSNVPDFLCEVAQRYGAIASLELPHKRYYLVSDPEAIREVLVTKASAFRKGRGTDVLHEVLGHGLFTSEPPEHTVQRRLLQPAFHHERIAGFGLTMVEQTQLLVSAWPRGEAVDIGRAMRRLTLRIGAATLFSQTVDDCADAVGNALTEVMSRATVGIFGRLREQPSRQQLQRVRAARDRLHALADDLIAQRRKAPGDERADLFAMLVQARDENGAPLSDGQLRDEILTLLLAAQESTALALTWTCSLLASHPAMQTRLRQELQTVLSERSCTADDCSRLPYTTATFKEALRLFPPAWILGRRAIRPVRIADTNLPRGAAVYVSPYVVHRSARWYDEPLSFRPERWLADRDLPRFTYLPFGRGARGCIGESFAWMEGTIVLATILRRVVLRTVSDVPAGLAPLLTLRAAQPIQLHVSPPS